MKTVSDLRKGVESPPVAYCIRVYADTADGPLIIDVPHGHLTTEFVDKAKAAGGMRLRVHALDASGHTIDRVVVR